ncbi:hypothetical protein [Methanococcoides burtonii]|uniref:Uncharacterized protein n=1 Tax=Methanococcoides burtonii (strain DSM 6242 / NBRC 107633 / OCM 468 / ACE-M) TaxID=259564 RepID=Q12YX7_METBU|nr:hypothetical protein [Methanococcoides burtonii]ABE51349.1 Hypothetical protein Mbur_0354 [Methanococcoides burtonii DSM 6242]
MNLSIISEIDPSIVLGIVVSLIVMGIAVGYDKYKEGGATDPNTSISNPVSGSERQFSLSSLKESNILVGLDKKIKKLIKRASDSNKIGAPELVADTGSNDSGIKVVFSNLISKMSSIKLSLPERSERVKKVAIEDSTPSTFTPSAEIKSDISFDVDKIVGNKKGELDFDDNLINEMATGGSSGIEIEDNESVSDFSGSNDMSIDVGEFDFGFGGDSSKQDDSLDNDFSFDMPGDNSSSDDLVKVVAVDDFSFDDGGDDFDLDDDSDSFIESLKNDIIADEVDKVNFMSGLKGVSLDIDEIKTELETVLANLKKM